MHHKNRTLGGLYTPILTSGSRQMLQAITLAVLSALSVACEVARSLGYGVGVKDVARPAVQRKTRRALGRRPGT